jgi:uncharacterized protein
LAGPIFRATFQNLVFFAQAASPWLTGHPIDGTPDLQERPYPDKIGFMTIQEEIDTDLKDAMRSRDAERLAVLRMVKSALTNAAIEKRGATSGLADAEALTVIRKQVKQRQDSIESFEKGGRPELAAKERKEIEFLREYLPKPLGEDEIDELVKHAIAEVGATSKAQMGAVMKIATEKAAGRVEGKKLSQAVQKALQ